MNAHMKRYRNALRAHGDGVKGGFPFGLLLASMATEHRWALIGQVFAERQTACCCCGLEKKEQPQPQVPRDGCNVLKYFFLSLTSCLRFGHFEQIFGTAVLAASSRAFLLPVTEHGLAADLMTWRIGTTSEASWYWYDQYGFLHLLQGLLLLLLPREEHGRKYERKHHQ